MSDNIFQMIEGTNLLSKFQRLRMFYAQDQFIYLSNRESASNIFCVLNITCIIGSTSRTREGASQGWAEYGFYHVA